jgi:hypothetical protein
MGDTGLELASGARVGPDCLVLLGTVLSDQLRFAQIATKIATKLGRIAARAQAAENALASVRAEGLAPGVAEALVRPLGTRGAERCAAGRRGASN